jgi:cathepsin L
MKSLLVLSLLFALAFGLDQAEYKLRFSEWAHTHQKVYAQADFQRAFKAFSANFDFVQSWDAEANGYKVGLNQFADLTSAEFSAVYKGLNFNYEAYLAQPKNVIELSSAAVPDSIDWREAGAVTPVKDQGQCGSCWTFSATGSIEGAWKLANHTLVSLSEQNLVDCSKNGGNKGCDGGLMDEAFKYVIQNNGLDVESTYPYTAKDGTTCKFTVANVGARIKSFVDVASRNEDALKTAVGTVGPVSVAIDASHNSFQLYESGVYHQLLCSATRLDHGVLAVGYGTSDNADYWLVKNSWGPKWGLNGYIQMSRNRSNNCGISTSAYYPVA